MLKGLVKPMWLKQWAKNLFVFAGLIFGKKLFHPWLLARNILAFFLFCMISSSAYLIYDLVDMERDWQHATKRSRPLSVRGLRPRVTAIAVGLLLLVSLPLAFLLDPQFGLVTLAYLATMIAYSLLLKNLVIVDVLVIAAGYLLRVAAGVIVTGVPFSSWLYLCTTFLALFIGFSRWRHELFTLEEAAEEHRASLNEYTLHLLDELIAVVSSTTVIAYSFYTFSAPNLPPNHTMMLTIPFVLYGIFRCLYLIHVRNQRGTLEKLVFKDKPLVLDTVLWGLTVLFVLYIR